MINLTNFLFELQAADLNLIGVSEGGHTNNPNSYFLPDGSRVDFDHKPTKAEKSKCDTVFELHNPEAPTIKSKIPTLADLGVTRDQIIEALWSHLIDNDPAPAQSIKSTLKQIT